MPSKVALTRATDYETPELAEKIAAILEHSGIEVKAGQKILVKPNLLMPHELSCTNPKVTAAVCAWLLDHGVQVTVSDSPAFGTCEGVAKAINLAQALKPLGLAATGFSSGSKITLPVSGNPTLIIAREALEADAIVSVARIKAHSQMRITLSVKNCFGCILGLRKALAHVRFGQSAEHFADCIAGLWASLPPVAGVLDGIVAMTGTGPRLGAAYNLGLLGASVSAPALDNAIMKILQINSQTVPLAMALTRRNIAVDAEFTLEQPEAFAVSDFATPEILKEISFNPLVLAKSLVRRLLAERRN